MASKISAEYDRDEQGRAVLTLRKARGKFNLSELADFLRYENRGAYQGLYAVMVNAQESTCGSQWEDGLDRDKGDVIRLYEINRGENCPACGQEIEA